MLPNLSINLGQWLPHIIIIVVFLIVSLPTAIDKFIGAVRPAELILFILRAHILEGLLNV